MSNTLYEISERVHKTFRDTLDLRSFSVEKIYNGRAYRISGRGNETNIYIRMEARSEGICVNFSSVTMGGKYRRTGLFTKIVYETLKVSGVDAVIIGGVCTYEMLNWCNKNNFKPLNSYHDFIKYSH